MFCTAVLMAKALRKAIVSAYRYTGMLFALLEFQCEYYSKFIGERNASRNGESESKHELIFNYRFYVNNNVVVYL